MYNQQTSKVILTEIERRVTKLNAIIVLERSKGKSLNFEYITLPELGDWE